MNFSYILTALKAGHLGRRTGWNGKQQFVFMVDGSTFDTHGTHLAKVFHEGELLDAAPYLAMRTGSAHVLPWHPQQSDILADDWEIVEVLALRVEVQQQASQMTGGRLHPGALKAE